MTRLKSIDLTRSTALGVLLMAGLAAWAWADHARRSHPDLGGRQAVPAPAWAEAHHADVCRLAKRCDTPWNDIRWFVVDSTALPAVICPGAAHQYAEVWGCWEGQTRALTLIRRVLADTVIVRHELMHAAIWTLYPDHPCKYFNYAYRTSETACSP